jgi:hypothetical protein
MTANIRRTNSTENDNTVNEKPVIPPNKADFNGIQLDLFRYFLCNTVEERDQLSNTFDLWDSVPRYAVSRQQMDKIRKEKGFLSLKHIAFQYRQRPFEVRIQAARIYDDKTKVEIDYYPSANEELIEDALRRLAAEQRHAFFDKPNYRSGIVFSLHMLREELKRRGHTRSYQQIILSLNILASSIIEIKAIDSKNGEGFTKSAYFSGLSAVSKNKLAEDPNAKWIVLFHPLVTQSIDTLTYRQFNYAQMMSHQTQLARWLHKQLSLKFTFASLMTSFEMRYSTVKRDSALLEGYRLERKAITALDCAFDELVTAKILTQYIKKPVLVARGKIQDVVYSLSPHPAFCHDMKTANKRVNLAAEKQAKFIDDSSPSKSR